MFRKWSSLLALLIVGSMILAACGEEEPEVVEKVVTQVVKETVVEKETVVVEKEVEVTAEAAPAPKFEGPRYGGVLNVTGESPPTIDTPTGFYGITQIMGLLFQQQLLGFTEDFRIRPLLAESYTVSDDGLTYTFKLREGIIFHNGEQMMANDVVASFKRYQAVGASSAAFDGVEIEAVDDYTVVFTLPEVDGLFLGNIASIMGDIAIQPASVILDANGEPKPAGLSAPEELIGTGPYVLVEYSPDTVVVFQRHEDYQPLPGDKTDGTLVRIPYMDEIRFHIVPDPNARLAGFESGAYDILDLTSAQYQGFIENPNPNIKLDLNFPGYSAWTYFNHRNPLSADLNFRLAIETVLDQEEIGLFVSQGVEGLVRLDPAVWPREVATYFPDPVCWKTYSQNNPEKAKELLAASVYDGEEIVMATTKVYDEMYLRVVAMADQLEEKLGVKTKVEVYDWPGLVAKWEEPDWHISVTGMETYQWIPFAISNFLNCEAGVSNNQAYCNPELDAQFDALRKAITEEEQLGIFKEINRICCEDVAFMKSFDVGYAAGMQANIYGFKQWYRPRYYGVWRED